MEASLTGHLVLTTVHTNSAPAALTRLVDMGVAPFLVASSLSLVVGQRLARRPCASCIESYRPSDETMALLGITDADLANGKPRHGAGCVECGGTGYRGRLGIFEVLPVTAAMRQVLLADATEKAVARAARDAGMSTLRESGLAKAFRGETTFEEVIRVTSADAGDETLRCPDCRGEVGDDMVACPWCAAHLARSSCEMCGRPTEPSWVVCPWCRHSTGSHPTHHPLLPTSQHLRGDERVAVGE
jgi:type IV pilus assembly protein PilB